MRLLDRTRSVMRLARPRHARRFDPDLLQASSGPRSAWCLCAGPTGSGKTTTLYATLTEISDPSRNVMTVEDPVEYVFPTHQPDPDERAGRTHLRHRAALHPAAGPRRDPGRRDPRRRDGAYRRAVGPDRSPRPLVAARHGLGLGAAPVPRHGHRVLPHRLFDHRHRRSAPRSSDLPFVQGRLHPDRQRSAPSTRRAAGRTKKEFVRGQGCNFCSGTGYQGRIGVYELLRITPEIKRLVVGWATQDELRRLAERQGMRSLREEAINLVAQDVTTVSEVIRSIYAL